MNLSTLSGINSGTTAADKVPARKMIKPLMGLILLMLINSISFGQTLYFGGSGTWTGSVWSTTNAAPYTTTWVSGRPAVFNVANSTITGASTAFSSVTANENVTVTAGGTLTTGGTVATITVASGKTLDFSGQGFSTAVGTGFIKAGPGTLISANGNTYPGGFTLSDGVMVVGGVNAMGNGGALNINGGTMAAAAARNISTRYTGINIGGNFTFGTPTYAANITLADNVALGAATTRTITLGSTGTYSLGGVISGAGSNLNVAATAAGTLVLTGASTYSGLTTVSGGTLQLNRTGGGTIPATNSLVVNSGATVLISTAQTLNNVTVDAGGTLIVAATLTVTGSSNINGTFQINGGGWATGAGTWTYGAAGTLTFNNASGSYGVNNDVWWPTSNGPVNVTVAGAGGITMNVARTVSGVFQTSATVTTAGNLTLNGTGKINVGGFFAATPVWGAASTLIYSTGTTYGRNNEFPNSGSLPSNVQLSANTTLNYPNGGVAARTLTGNLTIDAGSAFYMDFGAPVTGVAALTINSLTLAGNLSLGNQTGGDLIVKGNFTRTGTFTPNGRAVFFNAATGNQTLTGNTTFDYVIVDKAAGSVVLAGNMIVAQILTLTNGTVNTAANVVNLTNSGTGSLARTNGYVNGNLQRAIATGTNTYLYAVGTATGYTPASFAFTGISGAGSITLVSADAAGANYPAALNATKRLARNWTATNSGVTGIGGSATFTYLTPGDLAGGAVSGNLKAYVYNGSAAYPTSTGTTSNSFTFNGLTSVGEFGAGECGTSLAPTFTKKMASSCGGGADGSITVTPVGGVSPYTYSWTSNPSGFTASTAAITGLAPKDYSVVVTDAITCTASIPDITIWQALAPTITHSGSGSSSCGNTGSIILYAGNGVAPYTYSIDGTNYFVSNTFTSVAGGTYTGYVKDFANCITTKPGIVVTSAAAIVVTSNTRPASSCANNGVIELYRTGGVAPYTYSLDDVTYQGSNTFTNLAGATSYTGWVKDSKGCKTSLPGIAVGKATAVTATQTHTNASACANDGTLTITGHGGVPGFTYSITGANGTYQNSGTFTGLAAGSYTGWAQDSKGCKNFVAITITAAGGMTVTATGSDAGGCNNAGKIQVFVSGGVGPYTYSLDNVGYVAGNTFTGLTAGTYTAYVKDSKGCVSSIGGITVTNTTTALSTTESHTQSSTCVNDGTIQLRPAGGVAPYTYSLDNITYQGTAYFTGLAPTSYTGWVKDANGCTASVNLSITANPIIITEYVTDPSNCAVADGKVQLFRTGGTGPYTYSSDNVTYQASNTFTGLLAGTYTFYVKDSKGCVGSISVEVGPGCPPGIATNRGNTSAKVSVSNALKVQAYPNPTATEFTLKLEGNSNAKVSITVTDLMGRSVLKLESAAGKLIRFGNELKAGVYLVQVMQGGEMQSVKLVKE